MNMCLIAEGSYPYIAGGVSSWINQIITSFPDIDFTVVSIMPSRKEEIQYKYPIAENVKKIRTIYLDDYVKIKHKRLVRQFIFSNTEKVHLRQLLRSSPHLDWDHLINMINEMKEIGSGIDFLQSKFFFNEIVDFYKEKYSDEVFNIFFWTVRNIFFPVIYLIQQKVEKADIYLSASTGYAGILATSFAVRNKKGLVLAEHGIYGREREEELLKAKWVRGIYKKLWIDHFYSISSAAYKRADIVTALFQANREIQIKLGVDERKAILTPNGINYDAMQIERVPHDGINIGSILRIVPIKDVMTMIRAFRIVKDRVDNVTFYLMGPTEEDTVYAQQCVNLVKLLDLQDSVIFTGRVDVKTYLGKLDILTLTSISEGQPLVILEGWAAKIPSVSTDVGSCRELLEPDRFEGPCGLVTKIASPTDTAKALLKLINNQQLRIEMGENGYRRGNRFYNEKVLVSRYRQIFDYVYKKYNK